MTIDENTQEPYRECCCHATDRVNNIHEVAVILYLFV